MLHRTASTPGRNIIHCECFCKATGAAALRVHDLSGFMPRGRSMCVTDVVCAEQINPNVRLE